MTSEERTIHVGRKRLASQAAYARSKKEREHVLLRLQPGSLARIDQSRASLGMTRSAYVEWLLDGAVSALSATRAEPRATNNVAGSVGDEFEALFGAGA